MAAHSYNAVYRHSWALVVGIDKYQDPRLPPLLTAARGAHALAQTLQDDFGFAPERIVLLLNEEATQRAIRRALVDPLSDVEKVGPDDRVVFYFAGHGLTYDTAEGEIGCIAPYDLESQFWDTALAMDELTRLANRIHAKHILFLLDACFSGFATTREIPVGVERQLSDYLTRPVRQVITAGTREQAVSDVWGPGNHSLFTGFLLDGLRGAAPAPGGVLRAFHLAGYLQDQVAQHSRSQQTPQYAALLGSQGGDFIFHVRDVVELPGWLRATLDSPDATQRLVAVSHLLTIAREDDARLANVALEHLQQLAQDDNPLVFSSAQAALRELVPAPVESPAVPPAPSEIDESLEPAPMPAPSLQTSERSAHPSRRWVSPLLWGGMIVAAGVLVAGLALAGVFSNLTGGAETPEEPATEVSITEASATDEPTSTEAVHEAPADTSRLYAEIASRGLIVVGINDGSVWPLTNWETGTPSGFEIELAQEIVQRLFGEEMDIEWRGLTANDRFPAVQSGQVDFLIRNTTHTRSREEDMGLLFTSNYFLDGCRIMVRRDTGIADIQDMDGTTVSLMQDSVEERAWDSLADASGLIYEPLVYSTPQGTFAAVAEGIADATVGQWIYLLTLAYQDNSNIIYEFVGDIFPAYSTEAGTEACREPYAIVLNDADFRDEVDAVLLDIIAEGTWQAIYDDHFLDPHPWTLDEMLAEPPPNR